MNLRTTRERTARPTAAPGSAGRARLGHLTGGTGILKQKEADT
ncbi:hypothetical protein ABZX85_34500 [Streptomyces sp. NPDC004539]